MLQLTELAQVGIGLFLLWNSENNNCCLCSQYMDAQKLGMSPKYSCILWTYGLLRCPLVGFNLQLQLVYQVFETSHVLTILLSL